MTLADVALLCRVGAAALLEGGRDEVAVSVQELGEQQPDVGQEAFTLLPTLLLLLVVFLSPLLYDLLQAQG